MRGLAIPAIVSVFLFSSLTVTDAQTQVASFPRLAWEEAARNRDELATLGYFVYVDNKRQELADVSCGSSATPTGFPCSVRLPTLSPGLHRIELTAFVRGSLIESARSAPLSVFSNRCGGLLPCPGRTPIGSAVPVPTVTTSDSVHLRVEVIADGLQTPTDLTFGPDGRAFVAERAGRVRIVHDGRLQPEPALVLADITTAGGGGLLSLALDPEFEETRFIYVLYTTASRDYGASFRLARFQEVNGTFGERAILLDHVPASPGGAAGSVRFGADGKLYVALDDGGDATAAGNLGSFNGKILRLEQDGSTPRDQAAASPVYSSGYQSPRGFDWLQATEALWIADGLDLQRLTAIVPNDLSSKAGTARTRYALPAQTGASGLVAYRGRLLPAFHDNLLIAAEEGRYILRIRLDEQDPTRIVATERLLENAVGTIRVVSTAPDGAIYFCTDQTLARLVPADGP